MQRLLRRLDARLPRSIYLRSTQLALGALYRTAPTYRWNQYVKRATGAPRTPRWAPELFQLAFLLLGGVALMLVRVPWPPVRWLAIAVAAVRIIEIGVFSLHWVFVAADPLESFRRSLISFFANLCELALFYAVAFAGLGCAPAGGTMALLYSSFRAAFSLSLIELTTNDAACDAIRHAQVVQSSVLVLVILTVVIGGIKRADGSQGGLGGAGHLH